MKKQWPVHSGLMIPWWLSLQTQATITGLNISKEYNVYVSNSILEKMYMWLLDRDYYICMKIELCSEYNFGVCITNYTMVARSCKRNLLSYDNMWPVIIYWQLYMYNGRNFACQMPHLQIQSYEKCSGLDLVVDKAFTIRGCSDYKSKQISYVSEPSLSLTVSSKTATTTSVQATVAAPSTTPSTGQTGQSGFLCSHLPALACSEFCWPNLDLYYMKLARFWRGGKSCDVSHIMPQKLH